jgi:tripartite-type tricarboxylate transporter receptor subunit TctC
MDTLARILVPELQAELGGTFIVENKPGASGRIGAELVARAAPDGYTLFISGNSTHSANPSLYKALSYDPVKDFTPIGLIATMPYAITVRANSTAKTLGELAAQARANPGKFNYGYGSPSAQVATVTLASIERFSATGVPYKGQPPAIIDLLGGSVDFLLADLPVLVPHVRSGKLRALAVFSQKRSQLLPDVPTMREAGISGYDLAAWIGVSGPVGMPSETVNKLSAAMGRILTQPKVTTRLAELGMEPAPNTPEEFGNFIGKQLVAWGKRVREARIQPE